LTFVKLFTTFNYLAQNAFRLANIYQNDMVLQMQPKKAFLWGFGEPGAQIDVNYEDITLSGIVERKFSSFSQV
jgi:hypothetical protein